MIRTGFKPVSGAGPVREQSHGLLGPTSAVAGDGPAAGRGAPRFRLRERFGETSPEPARHRVSGRRRARPPAIGFETSSSDFKARRATGRPVLRRGKDARSKTRASAAKRAGEAARERACWGVREGEAPRIR
jgi:hypothetical protein